MLSRHFPFKLTGSNIPAPATQTSGTSPQVRRLTCTNSSSSARLATFVFANTTLTPPLLPPFASRTKSSASGVRRRSARMMRVGGRGGALDPDAEVEAARSWAKERQMPGAFQRVRIGRGVGDDVCLCVHCCGGNGRRGNVCDGRGGRGDSPDPPPVTTRILPAVEKAPTERSGLLPLGFPWANGSVLVSTLEWSVIMPSAAL